jgi:starch synthase
VRITNTHTLPWSPDTDVLIAQRYSIKTLEQKVRNKAALQKELGWPVEGKRAMAALPLGMTDDLGGSVLRTMLPGLLSQSLEIVILGKGGKDYGALFTELQKESGHRIAILPADDVALHRILAGADMALFLSDVGGQSILQTCLAYGVVPIAPETDRLESYDPVQERGDAFLFSPGKSGEQTAWSAYAAVVRAIETFKFPFDWRTIQRHCMEAAK